LTYLQLFLLFILTVNVVLTPNQLYVLGLVIVFSSAVLAIVILLDQWGVLPAGLIVAQTAGVDIGTYRAVVARTGGLWGDANFTALQLTIALPFVIQWWFVKRIWWQRIILLVSGGMILLAFTYTFSTSGFLGLLTILVLQVLIAKRRNILSLLRVVLLIFLAIGILFLVLPDLYVQRLEIKLTDLIVSILSRDWDLLLLAGSGRGDTWMAGIKSIIDAPVIGHGPGNAAFVNVRHSLIYSNRERIASHNMYLTVGVDLGLAGLVLFIGLLIASLRAVEVSLRYQTNGSVFLATGKALFIALAAYMVQGLAIDAHNMKLLWILLGMTIVYRQLFTQQFRQLQVRGHSDKSSASCR